jgi:hypothetical protein
VKTILTVLLITVIARAQVVPEVHHRIQDDTVLFNFRGQDIKAKDLPGRTLGCRAYIAKRSDEGLIDAFHEEYTSWEFFKPFENLTRIEMQIDFSEDWQSANVWTRSNIYKFKPLKFKSNGIRYTHQYDILKQFDPERSQEPYYKELAQKALDKKEVSKEIGILNLAVRWAPVGPSLNSPHSSGYTVHLFVRISSPRFYLQVSETSDPVNDEWFPSLWGDHEYLEDMKVIPKFGRSVWKDALTIALFPTVVGGIMLIDWSQDDKILRGAYCYPGAPRMLDEYEKLPLGRKLRNLEESREK